MHCRLVCGESTAFGLLATRDRAPLRRELGLSPIVGGQPEFPKKGESFGGGEGMKGWH